MSYRRLEKSLLYPILLSTLAHAGIAAVIYLMPPPPPEKQEQVTMVDLQDFPILPPPRPEPEPLRRPEPRPVPAVASPRLPTRVPLPKAPVEAAPKAENKTERIVETKSAPNAKGKPEADQQPARSAGRTDSVLRTAEKGGKEAVRGEGVFRPQTGERMDLAKLFPTAKSMTRLEDNLRKKYEREERGDTRLMDSDDPTILVFNSRFKRALRDRLNSMDSTRIGVGRTIISITFERDGSVSKVRILESSGNSVLDELTTRASRNAGFVGPLPKAWQHEQYNMICAFTANVATGSVSARWYLTDTD